jgi:NAD(P)-dependent dehydrogenase (short-subunit alcohol dehydrogenase family)
MTSTASASESYHAIPPRPSRTLAGKVAIVTGAGSQAAGLGNGRASAILLAEAGAKVICSDIDLESASQTVSMIEQEFGQDMAMAIKADVTKEAECQEIVNLALSRWGRLDILINNVGIAGPNGTALNVDPNSWAHALEVNVTSMALMAKYAIPAMEKNDAATLYGRGSIVNMASIAGMWGGVPILLYPTSKGAVINMTRAMAAHHGQMSIRVNCVCPGMSF